MFPKLFNTSRVPCLSFKPDVALDCLFYSAIDVLSFLQVPTGLSGGKDARAARALAVKTCAGADDDAAPDTDSDQNDPSTPSPSKDTDNPLKKLQAELKDKMDKGCSIM